MRGIKRVLSIWLAVLFAVCGIRLAPAAETENSFDLVEIRSNRHTKVSENIKAENRLSLDGYEKKCESAYLEIWFNPSVYSIRIVDKANGYIWGSLPDEKGNGLNSGWRNFANSVCSVEYYNANGSESRLSISEKDVKSFFEWESDGFLCTFNAKKLGIVFDFRVTLNDSSLSFEVVKDSLQENGDAKIKALYFMPFLGSSYTDEINGYIFIPDGCGALMRFKKSSSYITGFDKKIYGVDGSIDSLAPAGTLQANRINEYLVDANTVTMPVFGIAHGSEQNAFLSVVESGAEYASVTASPAGVVTDYNWASVRFNYRQLYTKTVSGSGIPVVQENVNRLEPKLTFYFLNGTAADYSGMANLYRGQLLQNGTLGKERDDEKMPLRLEIAGSTVKKGFIFNRVKTLTSARQALKIVESLADDGIDNLTLVYRGWQSGSTDKSKYGKLKIGRQTGGKGSLLNLKNKTESMGSGMYLYLDPVLANGNQIYMSSDAAIGIDETFISRTAANKDRMYPTKYFAKISRIADVFKLSKSKFGEWSFAYDSVGSVLYSDYSKKAASTRTQSLKTVTKALDTDNNVALYNPNDYCWQYTDDYFNIPVNNSQYQFETDTVPFLQMVLKGSVDYYSEFINQGYCSQSTVLKLVEYGVYPSFIVMAADNYSLTGTAMSDYFSLCFDDWKEKIGSVYEQTAKAMEAVEGAYITEHKALSEGVVRVTYSNGKKIYLNYLSKEVTADGNTVGAEQYLICS